MTMDVLQDPNVQAALGVLLGVVIKQIANWIDYKVDPKLLEGVGHDVVNCLTGDADSQRDSDGKLLNSVYVVKLRKNALEKFRRFLLDRKPFWWMPKIVWKRAVNKIDDALLMKIVEGIIETAKDRFKK